MTTRVFTHRSGLEHNAGPDHPEHPARLSVLLAALSAAELDVVEATPVDPVALSAIHPEDHLAALADGSAPVPPDTGRNEHTWPAVLGGAGAAMAAVDWAVAGSGHAFAAVRPPGHHASARQAMGFCFVNNVVVAAYRALDAGLERVLIIDWDVHHGNGTQDLVQHDPSIRFVSLHQWPWYPGTGAASDRGVGNVFNVPRPPDLPPPRYVEDLWGAIEMATGDWSPGLILVSAGFDAMAGDPLGGFTLEAGDYAEWTMRLRTAFPQAPIVGTLEGGYIPERIAEGALAFIGALA